MATKLFWEDEAQRRKIQVAFGQPERAVACAEEVEWFVKMVEERKKNNDHTKEKKSW